MSLLPAGWRRVELQEVAEVQTGLAKGATKFDDPVELPYLRVANVQDGYLDLTEVKTVKVERSRVDRYRLRCGDVLLTEGGDFDKLGRGAVWQGQVENCLHQNHVFAVRPDADVLLPEFLSGQTSSSYGKQYFLACAKQTTNLASINSTQLKQFPVLLPPLSEQRKIAQILGTWDAAIGRVEQLIAALGRRKQGLMQRLLTGEVRFAEFGDEIWKETELSELVEPVSRFESVSPDREYRLIGVRLYLEGAHIHDVVSGDSFVSQSLSRIEEGDILYNKMWVSKAAFAVAKPEHAGAYGTGEYPQFRAKAGLDVDYLACAFHSPRFQHDATALCRGTTGRIRLHPRDFLQLRIPLPPLAEQRKIAAVLRACDEELALQQQKLAVLRRQKQGLMQRLLTGEVRVKADSC